MRTSGLTISRWAVAVALAGPLLFYGCNRSGDELKTTQAALQETRVRLSALTRQRDELKAQVDTVQASMETLKKDLAAANAKLAAAGPAAAQAGDSNANAEKLDSALLSEISHELDGCRKKLGIATGAAVTILAISRDLEGAWTHAGHVYSVEKFEFTGKLHFRATVKLSTEGYDSRPRIYRESVTGSYDADSQTVYLPQRF